MCIFYFLKDTIIDILYEVVSIIISNWKHWMTFNVSHQYTLNHIISLSMGPPSLVRFPNLIHVGRGTWLHPSHLAGATPSFWNLICAPRVDGISTVGSYACTWTYPQIKIQFLKLSLATVQLSWSTVSSNSNDPLSDVCIIWTRKNFNC